jgi:hypothetical protein
MKKKLSTTKIIETLGPSLTGDEMPLIGLAKLNDFGVIAEHYGKGSVAKMLSIVEMFYPEIHIVTYLRNGNIVNRYESENALHYKLYRGDNDPTIEFFYDEKTRLVEAQTWEFLKAVILGKV